MITFAFKKNNMQLLENSNLKIQIKETGAELTSIFNKETQKEILWQGNPDVWNGQAPILFPVIGCLKDGHFLYEGKEYPCPKHGFIRNNDQLKINSKTSNSIEFKIESSEEIKKIYPFEFEFFVKYSLNGNKLKVAHKLINKDSKSLYFQIGGHTAFNCPLHKDENYSDYYLELEEQETAETLLISLKNGLITHNTEAYLKNSKKIPLTSSMFNKDALIFKNLKSNKVSLQSTKNSNRVTVDFKEFPLIAFWAKPNSTFICIEPWLGIADYEDHNNKIEEKREIQKLSKGKTFEISYEITIE